MGCSTLEGQRPVAYIVDGMDRQYQYLSYDQVRTMFHEFGHALNIALSNTKYQYHSCARASLDIAEIPSHFTELYIKDYEFVRRFAMQPAKVDHSGESIREPIERKVFRKMLFCEEIFRFMALEETLFFTSLDVDLNSFTKDDKIDEETLLAIASENLNQAFTCDRLPKFPIQ